MIDLINGTKLIGDIHNMCKGIICDDCSMCTEDGSCKVEDWLDTFPSVKTKEIKYYDDDESVWKIGRVIVDETD